MEDGIYHFARGFVFFCEWGARLIFEETDTLCCAVWCSWARSILLSSTKDDLGARAGIGTDLMTHTVDRYGT